MLIEVFTLLAVDAEPPHRSRCRPADSLPNRPERLRALSRGDRMRGVCYILWGDLLNAQLERSVASVLIVSSRLTQAQRHLAEAASNSAATAEVFHNLFQRRHEVERRPVM